MLFSKEKITQTIFDAVEEVNILLSEEERLEKLPETLLASEKGNLDSLGLINFIVEVESRVQKELGLTIDLIKTLESPDNPMESIGQLIHYIEVQANGKN